MIIFNEIKRDIPIPTITGEVQTVFAPTQPMPTYLISLLVFNEKDFGKTSASVIGDIKISVWARKSLVDQGFATGTLDMAIKVFSELLEIFKNVDESSLPSKIDIFAIPEYSVIKQYSF